MNSPLTVDASVFVNAFSPIEDGSDKSFEFITQLRNAGIPLVQPTLFLPEVVASIARRKNNTELALELARDLEEFSNLTLVSLDESIAKLAVEIAAKHRLRGSDAVYASVALRFGTQLVTLDREQLERLPKVLPVRTP
jgi:predicted nucleic acid-binding protein